jgi:hypothetical protein
MRMGLQTRPYAILQYNNSVHVVGHDDQCI